MIALLVAPLLVIVVDQAAKIGADRLPVAANDRTGILRLERRLNVRQLTRLGWGVLVAAAVASVVVEWRMTPYPPLALGIALGGIASNTIDRLARGGVVDFIGVGRWPLFNLADAAIVAGVLTVVVAA